MIHGSEESQDFSRLARLLHEGRVSRREFMVRATALGVSGTVLASLLRVAPSIAQSTAPGATDLEAMKLLIFGEQGFFEDPTYVGPNAGGLHGRLPVGGFPGEPLSFLKVRASKPWKIAATILFGGYPLPVAFAERCKQDAVCMGVEVLSYDFELKAEKGVEIADLMVQQGVQFATILQAYEDVNDQIVRILDEGGIKSMYYAVPPKTATGYPYLTLPDVSTGVKLGTWQGNYAKDKWGGKVDLVVQIGQEAQGVTSELRLQGGRTGLEAVLGAMPDSMYVYVDAGDGTVESAQNAAAAVLPSYPDAKNIIGIAMHDGIGTGLARALEAAGRNETACVSGQPGTPEGIAELQRGGVSAFRVSALQDLAFASWQVALGIYALEGGELPDVCEFDSVLVTAETVANIPSQSNDGYACQA